MKRFALALSLIALTSCVPLPDPSLKSRDRAVTVRPPANWCVAGQVQSSGAAPIPLRDALIQVEHNGRIIARVRPDSSGAFSWCPDPHGGRLEHGFSITLTAERDGYTSQSLSMNLPRTEPNTPIKFELAPL